MFVIHFYAITKFNSSKNFSFQHKGAYNQKKESIGFLFEWVAQFLVSQIKSERIYL